LPDILDRGQDKAWVHKVLSWRICCGFERCWEQKHGLEKSEKHKIGCDHLVLGRLTSMWSLIAASLLPLTARSLA